LAKDSYGIDRKPVTRAHRIISIRDGNIEKDAQIK
jgi:hypothetical protein